MSRVKIVVAIMLTALIALVTVPIPQSQGQTHFLFERTHFLRQWRVANSSTVEVGTPYELHNEEREYSRQSAQLGYTKAKRPLGRDVDDVGWVGNSGGHFEFRRLNTRDHQAIRGDENLAIYNTKVRKFLTGDQVKEDGFSIVRQVWSSSPTYEWQLHQLQGASFALYNVKHKDYLISYGGNQILIMAGQRR